MIASIYSPKEFICISYSWYYNIYLMCDNQPIEVIILQIEGWAVGSQSLKSVVVIILLYTATFICCSKVITSDPIALPTTFCV